MTPIEIYGPSAIAACFIIRHLYNQKKQLKRLPQFWSENFGHLRKSIWEALKSVGSLLIISFCLACTFSHLSSFWIDFLINSMPIVAAFLVLWALLGDSGDAIKTWNGETPVELMNNFWFRSLNFVAVMLIFTNYFYNILKK